MTRSAASSRRGEPAAAAWRRALLLALLAPAVLLGASRPGSVKVLVERAFPRDLRILTDIRWAADDALLLGAGRAGVLRLTFEPAWGRPVALLSTTTERDKVWGASHVGTSDNYLVAAPEAYTVGWRRLPQGPLEVEAFEVVADVDVYKNRLLVLGAQRDDGGRFAPDGAIAWLGSLDRGLRDLRTVRFSSAGPGAPSMAACGPFQIGTVRFLAGGRFVVAPGSEPGVFLYDSGGRLLRTWDTTSLGIDTDCRMKEEQKNRLLADLPARSAWLGQRRTLEEIVPLPTGAGLLVRSVARGVSRWRLLALSATGEVTSRELPFSCASPDCHLRADVRGGRIAFLLVDRNPSSVLPSRLVVTTMP